MLFALLIGNLFLLFDKVDNNGIFLRSVLLIPSHLLFVQNLLQTTIFKASSKRKCITCTTYIECNIFLSLSLSILFTIALKLRWTFFIISVCSLILLQNGEVILPNASIHTLTHAFIYHSNCQIFVGVCISHCVALLCFTFLLFNKTPEAESMN